MEKSQNFTDKKVDLLGSPEKRIIKLKKDRINGFVQYKVDGDKTVLSKHTFLLNKITYVKVVKQTRHRLVFVGELSSDVKLKEASKFIDSIIEGI